MGFVGVAEQPFAGVRRLVAFIDFVMDPGDQRAFDAAGGADPAGIGDDRDALDLADQAEEAGQVADLLGDRGERDRGMPTNIGKDVEPGHLVEDRPEPIERGADIGGGETALRHDFDRAGGEAGNGEHGLRSSR